MSDEQVVVTPSSDVVTVEPTDQRVTVNIYGGAYPSAAHDDTSHPTLMPVDASVPFANTPTVETAEDPVPLVPADGSEAFTGDIGRRFYAGPDPEALDEYLWEVYEDEPGSSSGGRVFLRLLKNGVVQDAMIRHETYLLDMRLEPSGGDTTAVGVNDSDGAYMLCAGKYFLLLPDGTLASNASAVSFGTTPVTAGDPTAADHLVTRQFMEGAIAAAIADHLTAGH